MTLWLEGLNSVDWLIHTKFKKGFYGLFLREKRWSNSTAFFNNPLDINNPTGAVPVNINPANLFLIFFLTCSKNENEGKSLKWFLFLQLNKCLWNEHHAKARQTTMNKPDVSSIGWESLTMRESSTASYSVILKFCTDEKVKFNNRIHHVISNG